MDFNVSNEIKMVLEKSKEEIENRIAEEIKESFIRALSYQLNYSVDQFVKEFFTSEIAPILKEKLIENKAEIIKSVYDGVTNGLAEVGQKIYDRILHNLELGYNLSKILEALFR